MHICLLFLLLVGFVVLNFCGFLQSVQAGVETGPLKYCTYLNQERLCPLDITS
jgi:hypothetical protein